MPSLTPNLDDVNQTVICIPFAGEEDGTKVLLPSVSSKHGLSGWEDLHIKAYHTAWDKCLAQIQIVVKDMHAPLQSSIVQTIRKSYTSLLLGLPYAELPVFCILDQLSSSTFFNTIARQLSNPDICVDPVSEASSIYVTDVYPSDCSNLTTTMKAIISGFVDNKTLAQRSKPRPSISLANYDIQLLLAWYEAILKTTHNTEPASEAKPIKLVVAFHDFEQLDPSVMQDVLDICSIHIPHLPIVFLLDMSSPPFPSYLHTTFRNSTLSRLRIQNFVVPSGAHVSAQILLKTFFNLEFNPDIIVGPRVLQYLMEHLTRYNSSLDALTTILQVIHMKHFTVDPLTVLVQSTPSVHFLSLPTSFSCLDALVMRVCGHYTKAAPSSLEDWSSSDIPDIVKRVDDARRDLYVKMKRIRIWIGLFELLKSFMNKQGFKDNLQDSKTSGTHLFLTMIDALTGRLGKGFEYFAVNIKKFDPQQIGALLEDLNTFFYGMPVDVRSDQEEIRMQIVMFRSMKSHPPQMAGDIAEWLLSYSKKLFSPLEDTPLWDVWYTGMAVFPSELINPSMRTSIISGLLRPHDYAAAGLNADTESTNHSLWEFPDTSILFKRYLDSGKKINVYDWFESFQAVLETQRSELAERRKKSIRSSPKKQVSKKEKNQSKQQDQGEKDEAQWHIEVHARFMRALHELDYIGFIKHTGRNPNHVTRTVFDIND